RPVLSDRSKVAFTAGRTIFDGAASGTRSAEAAERNTPANDVGKLASLLINEPLGTPSPRRLSMKSTKLGPGPPLTSAAQTSRAVTVLMFTNPGSRYFETKLNGGANGARSGLVVVAMNTFGLSI